MGNYTGPTYLNPPSGDEAILPYGYIPSLPMGIIGILTFAAVAAPHLWYLFTRRGVRSVHGLFFFASVIEMLGYGGRLYSHTHQWSAMGFLVGMVLIQVATILMTAALYKNIQRGIKYTPGGRAMSPMRPRSLLTLFVILDTVWVIFQMAGEYFIATSNTDYLTNTTPTLGNATAELVFLAGNVLQAITIIIVTIFQYVIFRRTKRILANPDPNEQYPLLIPLWYQQFASFGLFFVRLVFRIARGAQGAYEQAWDHESYFGVFEFLPMLALVALWAVSPLWKFLFPFGHKHGEGAHTRDIEPGPIPSADSPATFGERKDTKN